MTPRSGMALASCAIALAITAVSASSAGADPAQKSAIRPHGAVENCSTISGFGEGLRDFRLRRNLVVGPLALLHAGVMLQWFEPGQKLFVDVKGGHRVTLELSHVTRRSAGLGFVAPPQGIEWNLRNSRRVVTFIACRRGERPATDIPDGWPVSGWVGGLVATSPRCVPLRVWVDDEPSPRRAVIPYGVRDCE